MISLNTKIQAFFSKAFNLPVLKKSRLQWIDYLKGIAIFLVVYRHTLIGIERSGLKIPEIAFKANMVFFSFRMPLFFMLSGIFITGSLKKRNLKQFISTKFENLFYPFLIWAFIQISLQILLADFTNTGRKPFDYIRLLYDPHKIDHFWYLPALFNTTVIYALFKYKTKIKNWQQILLGLILFFTAPYIQNLSVISDWMSFYIFFAIGDVISDFFFKETTQNFLKRSSSLLVVIPLFVVSQLYYLSNITVGEDYYANGFGLFQFLLIALSGCLTMFVIAFRLQTLNILSFLRVIGYHSLYIYVMHVMVAAFVRIIMTKLFHIYNPMVLLILGTFFAVVIPVIIYNFFIYKSFGWFLFSYHKDKQYPKTQNKVASTVAI